MTPDLSLPIAINSAERLARAVLIFHRGGPWSARDKAIWRALTGQDEATTKTLCDLARETLQRQRKDRP